MSSRVTNVLAWKKTKWERRVLLDLLFLEAAGLKRNQKSTCNQIILFCLFFFEVIFT